MQYIVVASPLKYGCMIIKKKAFIKVGAIDGYHTLICSLLLMGVPPQKTKEAIDLFLHSYTVVLITIMVYIFCITLRKRKWL